MSVFGGEAQGAVETRRRSVMLEVKHPRSTNTYTYIQYAYVHTAPDIQIFTS
jgi:hypothetical protein